MVVLNETEYRLCLLDTNAASTIGKSPVQLEHFLTWSLTSTPVLIPCFSVFTVLELRRRPEIYRLFLDLFRTVPCLLLKSHEQLLEEEVRHYPDFTAVDPILLAFSLLGGEGMDLERVLNESFEGGEFREQERYWNEGQDEIVEGITSLVQNFPPEGRTYSPVEVKFFVETTAFTQLAMRSPGFAETIHDKDEAVDIAAFPSLKATALTVFYKFYVDRTRKPSRSDAFDIIISTAIPYVDAIVTEAHQAEALRKMKGQDEFIAHLLVYTLRDFRHSAPAIA